MIIGKQIFDFDRQGYIMGILNITPDSFSDGGKYATREAAVEQALLMVNEGAAIIDIGGESTRPGHTELSDDEEIHRVVPIIEALIPHIQVPISIDTSKSKVAEAAIKAGASLVNDVWGFKRDPHIAAVTAKYNVPCCLMHNREAKITLPKGSESEVLITTMLSELQVSIDIALSAGIKKDQILLDPGIGFAKTLEDNLQTMQSLSRFSDLGYPILLGTSRKSMIGLTLDLPVDQRVEGTVATTVYGYMQGCRIFRVHDVKENYRALQMVSAIAGKEIYGSAHY